MADRFPLNERVDMLAAFFEADRVLHRARRLYQIRYPHRRLPARNTFARLFVNIQVHGRFEVPRAVNQRVVADESLIALVEAQVAHNPYAGQRSIAKNVMASRYAVQAILKRRAFHPYKVHLNQQLHGNDFENRLQYCNWMQA
ncbi:50S ribosomal protein L15 [Frankliniella fusca]|uniref:50S ribosomal protein L15 n=1 Tax=Frankliniella fusca TaxID=407009 RepID=A0AAE1I3H3_9NEOP|nr:50S ribosomal protein L15 [Frankliniella fusca]